MLPYDKNAKVKAFAFLLFFELLAVLRTQLVRTFGAFERGIGLIPKAFGIHEDAGLPNKEDGDRDEKQSYRINTANEKHGREHHQVIPVEDAACRAAAVLHDKAEGAKKQDTDEIANVEKDTDEEKNLLSDQIGIIKHSDNRKKRNPKDKDLIRRVCCGDDMLA